MLHVSRRPGSGSDTTHAPGDLPYGGMPATATGPGTGAGGQEREPDAGTDVSAAWVRLRQQGKARFSRTTARALAARYGLAAGCRS